jgi:hypothetical protein
MRQGPNLPESTANLAPWWREPMMWLVVGGPLAVVLAAVFTAVVAVRGADPVVHRGTAVPALKARNHAATGAVAPAAAAQAGR